MNDIILSALINLFALFGADNKTDKEKSLALVSNYLKYIFGVRNHQSYINLYVDLRGYYDDFPELDKDLVVEGICSNLLAKIRREEQAAMVLRLLEFSSTNKEVFNPSDPIFKRITELFAIKDEVYADFVDFVNGVANRHVLVIPLENGGGVLKTIFVKEHNMLMFCYVGDRKVMMNDIPVKSGIFEQWQQSGVLKTDGGKPYYYSTIMQLYGSSRKREVIELCGRDIEFRFDTGGDNGMHNLSFSLRSGQLVAIMGGSGVGKSTLLSLLNGNLKPQSGSITINGHDISTPEAKMLIGFVPQDDLLIEELTVYQNLWYTGKLCFDKLPDEELDKKVMSVLVQLGLDQAKDLKVGSPINKFISGGQRKRLNIALELIREPAILFLDEPTSGLSSTDTEKVINLLKEQTGKGKLIVVNIHQPSSDVYKLFDRLWLLDRGGYPVFDGNPIEAISYFKSAANYADSDISACPTCGNVNPEVVLNIIDEKALDATGQQTERRKVSPKEWHELYINRRETMEKPAEKDVPDTGQKRPNAWRQIGIFLERNFTAKVTNLQYILVTLLEAPVLAAICAILTHYVKDGAEYCVMDNKNLVSYFFMAIIVAIFLGMSGSAEEIIKDRALLKREKFLRLSYGSYIWSKIIYMAVVCMIQTLLFIVVGNLIMGIHGMFWIWWAILFVSAFLSSLIGLLLSQCLNSVVAIYITIPLLLIPQILLCGLVVKFEDLNPGSETGNVPVIGDVIPSRWAYEALAVASFSRNRYEEQFFLQDKDKFTCQYYQLGFLRELEIQLEQRQEEIENRFKDEKPEHLDIIRHELPKLARVCGIDAYQGDESYESLHDYFSKAKSVLSTRGNRTTLEMDKEMSRFIRENSMDELTALKKNNYNLQLENLVLNRDTKHICTVIGNTIVPRCGYIFLTPESRNGRAPFYSGVKKIGDNEVDTLWFDLAVLLLMCLAVGACLFLDFPGQYVREERN